MTSTETYIVCHPYTLFYYRKSPARSRPQKLVISHEGGREGGREGGSEGAMHKPLRLESMCAYSFVPPSLPSSLPPS